MLGNRSISSTKIILLFRSYYTMCTTTVMYNYIICNVRITRHFQNKKVILRINAVQCRQLHWSLQSQKSYSVQLSVLYCHSIAVLCLVHSSDQTQVPVSSGSELEEQCHLELLVLTKPATCGGTCWNSGLLERLVMPDTSSSHTVDTPVPNCSLNT